MTDPFTPQTPQSPQLSQQAPIGRAGPGTVVGGRYTLRAAIGHGGMGTVWRGTDTQLGRSVAVKEVVTPPGIAPEDRDSMYERMLREARAAAMISHPGVVQVYDVVTDGGRPWIVMELLDARSLSDMVLEDGPLAPRAVAKIGVTMLGALEVAHAAGVLHRDVKPANVLVCTDGRCVLTDFGVARMPTDQQLTTPGMVLGSPHFISPERALGASFGPPSDLFSLGVTLYCAVEGRPPFDKGEPIATMHSVVEDPPLPPQRAGVLTDILYGLLEKNPDHRWDAPTARTALRELLAGPLASTTPQFPTDPYAVVPAQRVPWQDTAPASPPRKVGGRAMLAPGEDPTSRRSTPDRPRQRSGASAASLEDLESTGALGTSTAAIPTVPDGSDPGDHSAPPAPRAPQSPAEGWGNAPASGGGVHAAPGQAAAPTGWVPAQPGHGGGQAGYGSGQPGWNGANGRSVSTHPSGATRRSRPSPAGQLVADATHQASVAARQAGDWLRQAYARAPRRMTITAAAGFAAIVLLVAVVMITSGGGDEEPTPQAQGAPGDPAAQAPGEGGQIPVRQIAERGVILNIPEDWQEDERTEIRIDYVDPDDPGTARIRLLSEPSGADPHRFVVEFAEPTIEDNCPKPYQRLDLVDIEVDGAPATQLDYVCGPDGEAQRTRWVTTVRDGTAYSFFLRVPADSFEAKVPIFDEMLRSFRVVTE